MSGVIRLEVHGPPHGKGRPRFAKGGRAYTPAPTRQAERRWWDAWVDAGEPTFYDAPIAVHVDIEQPRPKNHWTSRGELSKAGRREPLAMRKPDADNCLKLVLDALNTYAFIDDSQAVRVSAERRWAPFGSDGLTVATISLVRPDE